MAPTPLQAFIGELGMIDPDRISGTPRWAIFEKGYPESFGKLAALLTGVAYHELPNVFPSVRAPVKVQHHLES